MKNKHGYVVVEFRSAGWAYGFREPNLIWCMYVYIYDIYIYIYILIIYIHNYACGPKTVPVKRAFLNIAIVGWGGVGWGGGAC